MTTSAPAREKRESRFTLSICHAVLDGILDPIFQHDHALRITYANRAYLELAGTSLEAAIGRPYWEVFPRLDGPLAHCARAVEQPGHAALEDEFTQGDHRYLSRSYPITAPDGHLLTGVHILVDVTEARRLEQERTVLSEAVRRAPGAILLTDAGLHIRFVNPGFLALAGGSDSDWIGRSVAACWHPAEDAGAELPSERGAEGYWLAVGGGRVDVRMAIAASPGADTTHVVTLVDLRENKRAEAALLHERWELRERVKELRCLHQVAALAACPDVTRAHLVAALPPLLAAAYQYPEVTGTRICLGGECAATDNFAETAWIQRAAVEVEGTQVGEVVVCYLEPRPTAYEGPFLREERELVDTIARRLATLMHDWAAQGALRESEARFDLATRAAGEGIWEWNFGTGRLYHSRRVQELLGYADASFELTLASVRQLVHPDDEAGVLAVLRRHLEQHEPCVVECRLLTEPGVYRWFLSRGQTERDADGRPLRMAGSLADIHDRKAAEAALRESEERHRTLFETMEQGVIYQNRNGSIISANPAAQRILGLSRDQLMGRTSFDPRWQTVHEDGSPFPGECHPSMVALREGHSVNDVVVGVHNPALDATRWLLVNASPLFREGEPRPHHVYITFSDITGRKLIEQALAVSERRLRTIVDTEASGLLVVGRDGLVRFLNPAAERLLDRTAEQLLGMPLPLTLTDESGFEGPFVLATSLDGERYVETAVSQIDWDGESCRLVMLHDVTARASGEQQLRRLNRTYKLQSECSQALASSRSESELFARVCESLTHGGYRAAFVFLRDAGELRLTATAGGDPGLIGRPVACACDCPLGVVLAEGVTQVRHERVAVSSHCAFSKDDCGVGGVVALPLWSDEGVLGALVAHARDVALDAEEVTLLEEVVRDLAFGLRALRIDNARQVAERTLEIRNRALEASRNGIAILEAEAAGFPIVYTNPSFTNFTGYAAEEALGHSLELLTGEHTDRDELAKIGRALELRRPGSAVLLSRRKDGSEFWNEMHIAPVRDAAGRTTHFIAVLRDISERKSYEQQLEFQAQHDALTGLPNRNLLRDRLRQALVYARRRELMVGVIFLDIDHFKVVNDGLGHEAGDELLVAMARRLEQVVREEDTLARYGGDEFVLVLPELGSPSEVSQIAERVLQALAAPISIQGRDLQLTVSMGASLYPRDGIDPALLLRNADSAMYRAKEAGRNNLQYYTEELNARAVERLLMGSQLRGALERSELRLHFQPQLDLKTGRLCGAEALVRWEHPDLGFVLPGRFIPLAEETGLIHPIGEWVLREACRQAADWRVEGLPPITVAVNLSVRQLERGDLVGLVVSVLRETGLPPERLELEVTESTLMNRPEEMEGLLGRLKQLGVVLSLDDFGTGYSSLAYLRRFAFDKLKIDRSFIREITSDPNAARIALTIIAMSRSLGMRVIAEGVETEAQLQFLRRQGCHELQGYLLSVPLPPPEFVEFCRAEVPLAGADVTEEERPTILLVDDEANITRALQRLLRQEGYRVLAANSPLDGFDLLAAHQVQVVVSDQRMPEMSGTEFLSRVKEIYPQTVRIVLSGYTDLNAITAAVNRGSIYKFLTKPWDDQQLRDEIAGAFRHYERQYGQT